MVRSSENALPLWRASRCIGTSIPIRKVYGSAGDTGKVLAQGAPSPALAGESWGEGRGDFDAPHPALRATFSRRAGEGGADLAPSDPRGHAWMQRNGVSASFRPTSALVAQIGRVSTAAAIPSPRETTL